MKWMRLPLTSLAVMILIIYSRIGQMHACGREGIFVAEPSSAFSLTREHFTPPPLSETVETPHFTIHYKAGHEIFAQKAAELAENMWDDATSFMEYTQQEKTHIYMYPSEHFPPFTGYTLDSDGFLITYGCPFSTQSLGLNYEDEKGIITHEFIHILFNKRMNESASVLSNSHQWLVEGIATYYAQYPSVMKKGGEDAILFAVVQYLEDNNDFPATLEEITVDRYERLAYPLSYSVIKFIFDTYGREKFSLFLDCVEDWDPLATSTQNVDKAFLQAFGKSKGEIEKEWAFFVKGISVKEQQFSAIQRTYAPDWRVVSSWHDDKLLFVYISESTSGIYTMKEDGSDVQQLTENSRSYFDPKFSPDDTKIAFTSLSFGYSGYYYSIFVMNADGSGSTQVTYGNSIDVMGSWSPDSQKIAFTSTRSGNYDIFVMNADGSGSTQLTTYEGDDGWPAFSPDGKIVFVSDRGGTYDLYIMNSDGTEINQLTKTPEYENYPVFSPDGKKIAFFSRGENKIEICTMNTDGTERETVAVAPNFIVDKAVMPTLFGCPVWSPDSREIAFTAADQIFTVSINHSTSSRILPLLFLLLVAVGCGLLLLKKAQIS